MEDLDGEQKVFLQKNKQGEEEIIFDNIQIEEKVYAEHLVCEYPITIIGSELDRFDIYCCEFRGVFTIQGKNIYSDNPQSPPEYAEETIKVTKIRKLIIRDGSFERCRLLDAVACEFHVSTSSFKDLVLSSMENMETYTIDCTCEHLHMRDTVLSL